MSEFYSYFDANHATPISRNILRVSNELKGLKIRSTCGLW